MNKKRKKTLCRLCGEDNEIFWLFVTDCPSQRTYREGIFLDKIPEQYIWSIREIMDFSIYPTIYNLMTYQQEYNEQPIYKLTACIQTYL